MVPESVRSPRVFYMPILLIAVVGLVVWIVMQKRK